MTRGVEGAGPMTLSQAICARKAMESDIKAALTLFYETTGLRVESVDIQRHEANLWTGEPVATMYEVHVRTQL